MVSHPWVVVFYLVTGIVICGGCGVVVGEMALARWFRTLARIADGLYGYVILHLHPADTRGNKIPISHRFQVSSINFEFRCLFVSYRRVETP